MIPLFKPFIPPLPRLVEIMQSGKLTYGEHTKRFESELRQYFGTDNLMVVSSYSYAISIACRVLGLLPGEEVIMSPMACLVSTQPYVSMNLSVKWCDVDENTGTIDPNDLRKRISKRSKLIVHNHFCGYPGYIDEVNLIAKKHNIPVIDDGIEAFGSLYKGKKVGNCGTDITVFSLSAVRPLNTVEGGVLIFKDEHLFQRALLMRDCGIDRTKFRTKLGEIDDSCDVSEVGYAALMSDINGYMGCEQMKYINDLLQRHKHQAEVWDTFFKEDKSGKPIMLNDGEPNYWVYGILAEDKERCIRKFRDKGYYSSGVHTDNSVYSVFGRSDNLQGVKKFHEHFVALPCGWWME